MFISDNAAGPPARNFHQDGHIPSLYLFSFVQISSDLGSNRPTTRLAAIEAALEAVGKALAALFADEAAAKRRNAALKAAFLRVLFSLRLLHYVLLRSLLKILWWWLLVIHRLLLLVWSSLLISSLLLVASAAMLSVPIKLNPGLSNNVLRLLRRIRLLLITVVALICHNCDGLPSRQQSCASANPVRLEQSHKGAMDQWVDEILLW